MLDVWACYDTGMKDEGRASFPPLAECQPVDTMYDDGNLNR
jgi:hypothetical protein